MAQGTQEEKSLWQRFNDFASKLYFETNIPFINNTPFELRFNLEMAKLQGTVAFVDGALDLLPFVDAKPFERMGAYDSSQDGLGISPGQPNIQ